jgi:hypothetical protein
VDISPLNSRPGQPKKKHFNKCKVVKLGSLFVGGCWLTLQKIYTKGCDILSVLKKKNVVHDMFLEIMAT